jgi:hypothetical protein
VNTRELRVSLAAYVHISYLLSVRTTYLHVKVDLLCIVALSTLEGERYISAKFGNVKNESQVAGEYS